MITLPFKRILCSVCLILSTALFSKAQAPSGEVPFIWEAWMEYYYKDPAPGLLYDVYSKVVLSPENQGKEPDLGFLCFIATALKGDSSNIERFYSNVKQTTNDDLVKSFGWILWYLNTPQTMRIITELSNQKSLKQNKKFLISMKERKPVDLFRDDFGWTPSMLLHHFYATGSTEAINLFLSKIDKYESANWNEKQSAMNVAHNLRSICLGDIQILEYCKEYLKTSKEPATKILREIIADVEYKSFRQNSIGVAYVSSETETSYVLKITLPLQTLSDSLVAAVKAGHALDPLRYLGLLELFDDKGKLLSVRQNVKYAIQFWCDNDGGAQYRPTVDLSLNKKYLKRKLLKNDEIQGIACFVMLNRTKSKLDQLDHSVSTDVKLSGDYDGDGEPECILWTQHDEAENCDGMPLNHLQINLQVGKRSFGLRCCGP
jgi:hypothetical protein